MILSDQSIRRAVEAKLITIDPYDENAVQPSSVDLRLDRHFQVFRHPYLHQIDLRCDHTSLTEPVDVGDNGTFALAPGEFALGSTVERIKLPNHIVGRLEGKSSLGRLGLAIHATAGFVDAGWDGQLTLELSNLTKLPILLYPGMKIGQISFIRMTTSAYRPYGTPGLGSKYQHQRGPTFSRYWENFED